METTCRRCHQPIEAESSYCPTCGLPQLLYATENDAGALPAQPWGETVRDASSVEWKPALRVAAMLAIPAGLLSCGISPVGVLSVLWMSGAAAWAVSLYVRRQQPAWITAGAGARIGLVTGVIAAMLAIAASGSALFIERFALHQGAAIDSEWKARVDASNQLTQQLATQMGVADQAQLQAQKNLMMSPEGHAGIETFGMASNAAFLLLFAAAGGAMSARWLVRSRRSQV